MFDTVSDFLSTAPNVICIVSHQLIIKDVHRRGGRSIKCGHVLIFACREPIFLDAEGRGINFVFKDDDS